MGANDCSVCQSAVVATVNAELLKPKFEKRMTLRELEALSGLSRSALSRHLRKCIARLRLTLNSQRKAAASGLQNGREIVSWPAHDGKPAYFAYYDGILHENDLRPDDILFAVQYAPPYVAAVERKGPQVSDKLVNEAFAENLQREESPHHPKLEN